MGEFYITANSFAAPFFSDASSGYVEAGGPVEALEKFAAEYRHPYGLYAAHAHASADAAARREPKLAEWLCNHEREKARLTDDLGSFSYLGHGPGHFEINGVEHVIQNPKDGSAALSRATEREAG